MSKYSLVIGMAAVLAVIGSGGASAKECRETSSVVQSAASVQANTSAGGHVSIHVTGNATAVGKSRFDSENDFTSAFTAWSTKQNVVSPNPKSCGGGSNGVMDCVKASDVNITSGSVCKAVDGSGNCTSSSAIVPVKVAFRYAKSAGKWILNTAYPSVNGDCQ